MRALVLTTQICEGFPTFGKCTPDLYSCIQHIPSSVHQNGVAPRLTSNEQPTGSCFGANIYPRINPL